MDKVCQSLARRVFVQVPLDLRLDTCFPFIRMPFKEDGVDALREVGLGSAGSAGLFGEVKVGELGPYLGVVEFFVGFKECSGGLRWEVVVPGEDVIQCRSAFLAYPGVLLLCVEVPISGFDEVFQFVVRRPYIFIEGLSVVPTAPRVRTV